VDIESLQEALIGRWTIERELGRDPLVSEWLARDRDGTATLLQVAHPELAASVDPAAFAAAIDAVIDLRHPHLLEITDRGVAGGYLFVARRFVEAVSLRQWLEREPVLPFLETVRVLLGIADSLTAVHARGLVHGALDCGSILWHGTHVLLKDLGVAAALAGPLPGASEEVRAFGALAYEILTGVHPDPHGMVKPVNALREHQPPGLAQLVMRCLVPDPEARPTATELHDRLGVMITPAQGYRSRHLVAQAECLLRRGDTRSLRGALDRFRRAVELDPRLEAAREGLERTCAALGMGCFRHLDKKGRSDPRGEDVP
jgi:serine/threonine protein kinase